MDKLMEFKINVCVNFNGIIINIKGLTYFEYWIESPKGTAIKGEAKEFIIEQFKQTKLYDKIKVSQDVMIKQYVEIKEL